MVNGPLKAAPVSTFQIQAFFTGIVSDAGYFNSVDDTIKVAVIGCGGRGTGAAMQALLSKQNVKLVAMADAFRDRLDEFFNALTSEDNEEGNVKAKVSVTEATKFVGFLVTSSV